MHIPTILQTTDKTEKYEIDMSWLFNQAFANFYIKVTESIYV